MNGAVVPGLMASELNVIIIISIILNTVARPPEVAYVNKPWVNSHYERHGDLPLKNEYAGDVGRHFDQTTEEEVDVSVAGDRRRIQRQPVINETVDKPRR